uniref:Uncharacterized protein n=1 Tax=Rhizophora mucronata TaxID=61149 RepID=A0A2P2PJ94_RHIMU
MNNNTTETASPLPPAAAVPLPELIASLEQALLMAKQLPATADPNHLLQIYSSLHQAHHHLSFFVSHTQLPLFPVQPPQPRPENSVSSATGAAAATTDDDNNGNEPMQVGEDDYEAGAEENSSSQATIDRVEEKMRDCFIKNKRPKRPLSPSLLAEDKAALYGDGYVGGLKGFDPHGARLRALDLINQFHA